MFLSVFSIKMTGLVERGKDKDKRIPSLECEFLFELLLVNLYPVPISEKKANI